jgi:hypothetical protein
MLWGRGARVMIVGSAHKAATFDRIRTHPVINQHRG